MDSMKGGRAARTPHVHKKGAGAPKVEPQAVRNRKLQGGDTSRARQRRLAIIEEDFGHAPVR